MAVTYYLSAIDSDLTGGADFNKLLSRNTETAGTITSSIAQAATETSYAFTAIGDPGTGGVNTGTFTVKVDVATANSNITISVALHRVNSAGTVQNSTAFATGQSAGTTGVKSFTFTNPALGTWVAGDRLRVDYRFANAAAHSAQNIIISTGTIDEAIDTPFNTPALTTTAYWVGGSGNWDALNVSNWATSSGGTRGAGVPTATCNVFFDASSNITTDAFTVTVGSGAVCNDMTASSLDGVMTFAGSGTLAVSGSFSVPASNFTRTYTGSLTFNSTSTGKTITSNGITFASAVTFNGIGGAWTLQDAFTTTDAVTLTNGTLALGSFTLTCLDFFSTNSNTRTLNFGTGKIVLTDTAASSLWDTGTTTNLTVSGTPLVETTGGGATTKTINSGQLSESNSISFSLLNTAGTIQFTSGNTVRNLTVNGAFTLSNVAISIFGNYTYTAGTLTAGTNAWTFAATASRTITSGGATHDFPFTFNGVGGTWILQDALTVGSTRVVTLTNGTFNANNFSVTAGQFSSNNSNTRTITMGSGTWTLSGTGTVWDLATTTGLTFNLNTANITLSDTSTTARTFAGGGLTYNVLTIGGPTGTSTTTLTGTNTFSELTSTKTVAHTIVFPNATTTVTTFSISGSAGNLVTLSRTGASGTFTLTKSGSGLVRRDYLSISNSTATPAGTWYAGANSVDGGGNTGWNFGLLTLYWIGGTGTWDGTSTTNWSTVSGGSTVGLAPDSATNIVFDSGSDIGTGFTVTVGTSATCSDLTVTGLDQIMTLDGTAALTIAGSLALPATNFTLTYTGAITFSSTTSGRTLTSNGNTFSSAVTFNGIGGVWTLQDAFTTTGAVTLTNGTLALGSFTLTSTTFSSNNTNIRTIDFGTGKIVLTSNITSIIWSTPTITNLTISGTPLVETTGGGANTKTINTGALTESNSISFSLLNTAGTVAFTSGNTVRNLTLSGAFTLSNIAISIFGNYARTAGTLSAGVNAWTFAATSSKTISTGGATHDFPITFNGVGGTWTLQSALTVGATRTVTLTNGTFDASGFSVTMGLFSSNNSNTRTLTMGSGTWALTNNTTATQWNLATTTGLTFNNNGSPIVISGTTGSITRTFAGGGLTYGNIALNGGGGTSQIYVFTGSNTFADITSNKINAFTIRFTAGITTTFDRWRITGTSGNVVTVQSSTTSAYTLVSRTKVFGVDYLSISYATGSTPNTWYVGANSTDGGNNTDIIFTAAPSVTKYWIGGTGSWTAINATNWSDTSGGSAATLAPTVVDSVIFDGSSDSGTAFTVTVGTGASCDDFSTSSLDQTMTLAGSGDLTIGGSLTLPATNFTRTFTGSITLTATTIGKTITSGGNTFESAMTFSGIGGEWTLQDALTTTGLMGFGSANNTFSLNNYTVTCNSFSKVSGTLNFGTGKFVITTTSGDMWITGLGVTVTGTPLVETTGGSSNEKSIRASSNEANSISFTLKNTGGTVVLDSCQVKDLTIDGTLGVDVSTITIFGNFNRIQGSINTGYSSPWIFAATSSKTITTNGVTVPAITFNGVGGTWTLQDAVTTRSDRTVTLTNGTFNANNFSVTAGSFASNNSNTRTITMGSSTWTLSGTGTVWDLATTTGLTFNPDTADILLSNTSTTARTFAGGGLTYNKLTIGGTTGTSTVIIKDNNTFTEIDSTKTVAHNLFFEPDSTQSVGAWDVNGSSGNVVNLRSSWKTTNEKFAPESNTYLYGITWTGTEFVMPSWNEPRVYFSTDGITWNDQEDITTSANMYGVAYGNSLYIIVGTNGTILTSSDKITWTSRTSGTTEALYNVLWSGSQFVIVGTTGTILTSSDGINWTPRTSGTSEYLWGINWNGTQYVATGGTGTILSSSDAITWASQTSGISNGLLGIYWTGTQYLVSGNSGTILTSSDGITWTTRTSGTSQDLYQIAYDGSIYVAVGTNRAIFTSTDGIAWTNRTSSSTASANNITNVIHNGTLFVAIGQNNTVLTSLDGKTWRSDDFTLLNVIYDGSDYLAVGFNGQLLSSSDGQTWQQKNTRTLGQIRAIAENGTNYVAVGRSVFTSTDADTWDFVGGSFYSVIWDGSKYLAVGSAAGASSTDGITWTSVPITGNEVFDIVSTGSQYVAVGNNSGLYYSTDGESWITRPYPEDINTLYGVAWNGSLFVAVGINGTIYYSSDGLNWSGGIGSAGNIDANSIAWGNSVFVVVGSSGRIETSATGTGSWTTRTSGTANSLRKVIWGNNEFVAVGDNGTILTSSDGVTWTSQTSGTANTLYGIVWESTQYVVVGSSGTILTSSDAVTWTARTSGVTLLLYSITYGNSQYVAVGNTGAILTSSDGVTWTDRTKIVTVLQYDVIWGNNEFVTVGSTGRISTSSNGTNWTLQTSGTLNTLQAINWNNTQYVVVGFSGRILTSSDAITWTTQTSGTSTTLNSVAYNGSTYAVVGESGLILSSSDAVTWTSRTSGTTQALYKVIWDGLKFIAVGNWSTILTSIDGINWISENFTGIGLLNGIAYGDNRYVAVGNFTQITINDNEPFTLTKSGGGTVETSYLDIANSTATPANTWYARTGNGGVDSGGNTGWIFANAQNVRSALLMFFN